MEPFIIEAVPKPRKPRKKWQPSLEEFDELLRCCSPDIKVDLSYIRLIISRVTNPDREVTIDDIEFEATDLCIVPSYMYLPNKYTRSIFRYLLNEIPVGDASSLNYLIRKYIRYAEKVAKDNHLYIGRPEVASMYTVDRLSMAVGYYNRTDTLPWGKGMKVKEKITTFIPPFLNKDTVTNPSQRFFSKVYPVVNYNLFFTVTVGRVGSQGSFNYSTSYYIEEFIDHVNSI